ncbi:MAG: lysylphosphatidylglycerol synthase transmembrane domain-containing protein [Bacteroidales bacterium]
MVFKRYKKQLLQLLKLVVTIWAIYFVTTKIDMREAWLYLSNASISLLLVAILLYALSKLMSALRLNLYFREIGIEIGEIKNIKFYLLGMFYNLFLPGGIGGDGYKIYLIHKQLNMPTKLTTAGVLLDRLNGMTAILYILPMTVYFTPLPEWSRWLAPLVVVSGYATYRFLGSIIFPSFKRAEPYTTFYSILLQTMQVLAIYVILKSLGVQESYSEYTILFLISSLVSVLPISVGGVGIREMVFLAGSNYFGLNPAVSVMVSFVFYLINAAVSLVGVYYHIGEFSLVESKSSSK